MSCDLILEELIQSCLRLDPLSTLPSQPVFDSTLWSVVNSARRREKGKKDVPIVIPGWFIAARLAKLRTGLCTYLTVMLIVERHSPIISPIHVTMTCFSPTSIHLKIKGLITVTITWKREGIGHYYLGHQDFLDLLIEPPTKVMEDFQLDGVMHAWWYIQVGDRLFPNSTAWNDH